MPFWGEDFWDSGFTTKFFVAVVLFVTAVFVINDNTLNEVRELRDSEGMVVAQTGMSYDDVVIRMRSIQGVQYRSDPITDIGSIVYPVSFQYSLLVPWMRRLFPFNYVGISFDSDEVDGIYFFGDLTRKGLFFPPEKNETVMQEAVGENN